MAKEILLLMALEAEMGADNIATIAERCDVCFIGMGKLNAFEATMKALASGEYRYVINVGTCGSFSHPFGLTLYPSSAWQGDVYIDPEGLFFTPAEQLNTGVEGCSIVSSDSFIGDDTPLRQRELLAPYDCMDMEAYAVVRAVRLHSSLHGVDEPTIYLAKIVSDGCDGTVGDWESRITSLRPTVRAAAEDIIDKIEKLQP